MTAPEMIRDRSALGELSAALGRAQWVAMDTEFMRERTYAPQLCLIQVAADGVAACIDALAIDDLSPLGALLADDAATKIFHSCRQDLEALATRMDAAPARNLYDTQLAAAFCGYGDQASYAALVETLCAVHLPKAHTRADWSRRPLSAEQLRYAIDDVNYLQPMRARLDRMLAEKGRVEWHRRECELAAAPSSYRVDPADAWRRLKGVERIGAAGQACARALANWRERRAIARDLPRNWILPSAALLQISRQRPRTLQQLGCIDGIAAGVVKHSGKAILACIAQSAEADEQAAPPMLTAAQRRRAKQVIALLEQCAQREQISRSLLANRQEVENFVRAADDVSSDAVAAATQSPLFTGWRAQLVGDEIRAQFAPRIAQSSA